MKFWQDTFGQAQSKLQLAGWLLAFAFPVLALVLDKAASTIFAIFFLAGLWLLVRGRVEKPDPAMRWVLIAFASYFLVGVLSFFLGEQTRLGEKLLGRDIRFLGAVAVAFTVIRLAVPARVRTDAFGIAGILTGVVAVAQVLLSDVPGYRAEGQGISIVFGHLSAALAVGLTAQIFLYSGGMGITLAVGAIGAWLAALMSGTRGAVLAAFVISIILLWFLTDRNSRLWIRIGVALSIAVITLSITSAADVLTSRFVNTVEEVKQYQLTTRKIQSLDWPDMLPACFNHRDFLELLTGRGLLQGRSGVNVKIVKAAGTEIRAANLSCPDDTFIRFSAPENSSGWAYLPERSAPPGYSGGGGLLVRGRGIVRLLGNNDYSIKVASNDWRLVTLDGSQSRSRRHLIIALAGEHVDFVPVLFVSGEYEYLAANASLGSRLQMWRAAFEALSSEPVFGVGVGAYPAFLEQEAALGQGPWQITPFDHAHNEILTVAAERGILGLLTLFAVYAAPFWLFWRRRDAFGYAGMAFVASIFLSGLTETIFNHSLGITYYCMFVLLLATAPRETMTPDRDAAVGTSGDA